MTTWQAGADQLFGSYPSRADSWLCFPELNHRACFSSCHGFIDVPRYPIRSRDQRRIDLVDVPFSNACAGVADKRLDGRDGKSNVLGSRTKGMPQAVTGDPGNVFSRYFLKPASQPCVMLFVGRNRGENIL
jgi:hypothetical protein